MIREDIKTLLAENNSTEEGLIELSDLNLYVDKICRNASVICSYEEGKLSGLIAYYNNDTHNILGYLTVLVIARKYRSKGLGKILLESSLQDLKNKHFKKYRLEVLKQNKKAFKLYTKYGFVVLEDRGNVWLMEVDL
ncbi:GNAT family N-acetyltransferase [Mucilaginibacter lappiensis]|uniref:Ribosomal protein S18 acetylase RimI-like enzyme n=1 Tax=Mucilaginibacter lappiensis TaxID=354630 RepID=A0A841JIJ9_9SPHI|nr:GNAT family N-acetyltransferase [Mucilaginibacter lappiensis]MBB6130767.1 ribosomal protein S18 acetylase RimI-like enzyme [Mucilaginibacter lappiensis]